jgi:hypothetical protein
VFERECDLIPVASLDREHTERQSEAKKKQVMIGGKEDGHLVSLGVSAAFTNNSPLTLAIAKD